MSNRVKVVAAAEDGDPLVAHVEIPPGCLARLGAWLRRWLVRLIIVGAAFLMGYACKAVGG